MDIREATEDDVPDLQAIYAHHVLHGTGTFEEEPPPVEEMAARFHEVVDTVLSGWSLSTRPAFWASATMPRSGKGPPTDLRSRTVSTCEKMCAARAWERR